MTEQIWNAAGYARSARFVSDLGAPLLELLAPRAGERILDLGCGDGALTCRVGEMASVVGVDSSASMVEAACSRGVDAHRKDAQCLQFNVEFDAVFSNAALHWMSDIDGVLDGVFRALKPGGRFVGEFGGHGCVASICTALRAVLGRHGVEPRSPWYFPTTREFQSKLENHGFQVESIALIPRPTPLPGGVEPWLETFAQPFLCELPAQQRAQASLEVIELLRPSLCDAEGQWTADYMRLRFMARRPPAVAGR